MLMFDSLNRHYLSPYGAPDGSTPNFARLAARSETFDAFYAGSLPCMPARRELHTGRHNFLHRSWGPLEPFDDSMPELLANAGIHSHLVSDHPHYWEDGGATYHARYSTWDFHRGQEGDPWKGVVAPGLSRRPTLREQDATNREFQVEESEHPQTRTVDAGLDFIRTNAAADQWMLQLELFDPHEPFFAAERFRRQFGLDDTAGFDWPEYRKVVEEDDHVERVRQAYSALLAMCDASLGRVLDAMDEHDLWSDTMLIVNTDHGFLLGEHGWWAKSVQPWYEELVHLPFFLWDPRDPRPGQRRAELAQTIDIAPTVLAAFGLDVPDDMQGRDLAPQASEPPAGALFGIHGGHVSVTDRTRVYMRAGHDQGNAPLNNYTLMPTHMRARFSVDELSAWSEAAPFSFTKGLRTMRVPAGTLWLNPWAHGTLLFDLAEDPGQVSPVRDDEVELTMLATLRELLIEHDAPLDQFERLGIPRDRDPGPDDLLVRVQADRAASASAELPRASGMRALALLTRPLSELMAHPRTAGPVSAVAPELASSELLVVPRSASILDLARDGRLTADDLIRLDEALAKTGGGD